MCAEAQALWDGVQEVLDASLPAAARGVQGPGGRKWYFEKLDLQGIRCNLTLLPHGGAREAEGGGAMAAATRYRMASTLGIHLTEINSVPLRVNALLMKNAFVTPRALLSQLLRHLFLQARPPCLPSCLAPPGVPACLPARPATLRVLDRIDSCCAVHSSKLCPPVSNPYLDRRLQLHRSRCNFSAEGPARSGVAACQDHFTHAGKRKGELGLPALLAQWARTLPLDSIACSCRQYMKRTRFWVKWIYWAALLCWAATSLPAFANSSQSPSRPKTLNNSSSVLASDRLPLSSMAALAAC